jgi:hypothetical protein
MRRSARAVVLVVGWALVGNLSVRDTDGWREVPHATHPYETRESCEAARALLRTKALDDGYAVSDDLRCVSDSDAK